MLPANTSATTWVVSLTQGSMREKCTSVLSLVAVLTLNCISLRERLRVECLPCNYFTERLCTSMTQLNLLTPKKCCTLYLNTSCADGTNSTLGSAGQQFPVSRLGGIATSYALPDVCYQLS
ncbi:hypothetical protein E2C01_019999 [Portunus trituberculatus]|uniref:Uncharacterized protein n=1 Tax=Portunus trituberculatus TaxID=210409 RepID=A0A5B7DZE3_PORTR|nr:hypothetical protein [Portunus trituberculatus]